MTTSTPSPPSATTGRPGVPSGGTGSTSRRGRRRPLPRVLPSATGTRPGRPGEGEPSRLARVTERLSPVYGVLSWLSPLGWAVVALGAGTWAAGAVLGWTEWLVVAAGALALVAGSYALAVGIARTTVAVEVAPTRVTVGEPATGRLVATNPTGRRALPLVAELPVGQARARFPLPTLAAGGRHEEVFVIPTTRRGVIAVGPAATVQGDPLGVVRRTVRWSAATELVVHPRTVALEPLGAGLLRDLEGASTQDLSMSDLAFHALREYQPGDDRRFIHWRSSAKAGRLLVRQFLDTRRSHVAVLVDADPAAYRDGAGDVETAMSVAASIVVRASADEEDVTVVTRGARASRTTGLLTLDSLARAEVGPTDIEQLARELADLAADASAVILLTGARRTFPEVQRALGHFEQEVRTVAVTVDAKERVGVRDIGGLLLLSVGGLDDARAVLANGLGG